MEVIFQITMKNFNLIKKNIYLKFIINKLLIIIFIFKLFLKKYDR